MLKKVLSLCLALVLLVGVVPITAMAAESTEDRYVKTEELVGPMSGTLAPLETLEVSFALSEQREVCFDFSGSISGAYSITVLDAATKENVFFGDVGGEGGIPCTENRTVMMDPGEYVVWVSAHADAALEYTFRITAGRVYTKENPYYYITPEKEIYLNKSITFKVKALPESAEVPAVKWSVSNSKVAKISSSGKATGLKSGAVTIKATVAGQTLSYKTKVVAPTYGKLSNFTLYAGETKTLQIKVSPEDYPLGTVTWKTSNKSVATVSSKGVVTAKKAGKATITATVNGKKFSCTVTVKAMSLSATKKTAELGDTFALKVRGGTGKVTWSSSNKKVAKVNSSGEVTALYPGKATITAKKSGKTLTCVVTVKGPPETGVIKDKEYILPNGANGEMYKLSVTGKTTVTVTAQINSGNDSLYLVLENGSYSDIWSEFIRIDDGVFTKTATLKAGTYYLYCDTNNDVEIYVHMVTKPQIVSTSKYVGRGYTKKLKVAGVQYGGTWSSSNKSIATVSSDGVVKGKKNGTCTIYYTMRDGKKLSYKVQVVNPVTCKVTGVDDVGIFNDCYIRFTNYTNKKIKYIELNIKQYNYKGSRLSSPYSYYYVDEPLAAGQEEVYYFWVNDNAKTCKAYITKVKFTDGSTWKP